MPTIFPTMATKKPTTYTAVNSTTTKTTTKKSSNAAEGWFHDNLLSTQKGLIILSVSG
jgi:hypothetical protein